MEREEKRVICCTAENAPQVRAVVKAWPQLHGLVQQLQAGGIFPGLRSLEFTLRGTPEFREQGLDALLPSGSDAAPGEGGGPCQA